MNIERVTRELVHDCNLIANSSKYGEAILTVLINHMEPNPFVYGMWSAEISYENILALIPDLKQRKGQLTRAMKAAMKNGGLVRIAGYKRDNPCIYTFRSFIEEEQEGEIDGQERG